MKTLRPNRIAIRELRLLGIYRILYNVDEGTRTVRVVIAGEKQGSKLLVQGEEYTAHHESDLID